MRTNEDIEATIKLFGMYSPRTMMDKMMDSFTQEQESKPINLNTTIGAGLNKYSNSWVNAVAHALGISKKEIKKDKIEKVTKELRTELADVIGKLPLESVEALKIVMKSGGWVKYNQLSKEFGEDNDGFVWETEPPKSTVGLLRLHALLFIGKAGINGRMYKVAVVPKDIRKELEKMLK